MATGIMASATGPLVPLARGLVDLLLPPVCGNCRAAVGADGALCARCWADMRFIGEPLCAVYGTPFAYDVGPDMVSADAIADPPPFGRSRAVAAYEGVARALVHHLKYRGRADLAGTMATAMLRAGQTLIADAERIVPVPLHRWRLWRRRFNQAALLGGAIARQAGLVHDPLALARIRSTRHQVGLSAGQREINVRGAFRVPEAARIRIAGRRILLIDDVYTSGATVKAATRALKRAGAAEVDVLTFARVL